MAGKKGSRSSKTAHVLNLLSGTDTAAAAEPRPEAGTEPAPEGGTAEAKAPPQPPRERPILPPIVEVARTNNEALSETIRSALEKELEEQEAQMVPEEPPLTEEPSMPATSEPLAVEEPSAPPAAEPIAAVEPSMPAAPEPPVVEEAPVEEPAAPPVPEPSPAPAAPLKTAPQTLEELTELVLPDGSVWINVMLGLVEEKAERYIKMFGLCPCPRCLADVKALALSRLPAKYVVLPATQKKPMLSLFSARYEGDVINQVIYACKVVMDTPHHDTAQP